MIRLSRRHLLAAGLALPAMQAAGGVAPHVVTTELILTETLLALGLSPAAVGNRPLYTRLVGTPALPDGVSDLGPLNEPNIELLVWLRPDLILAADWQRASQAALERIAPVVWLQTMPFERPPLENARALIAEVGAAVDRQDAAVRLLAAMDERLATLRAALAGSAPAPLRLVRIIEDGRHAMVFGRGSLPGDVLDVLGLPNAAAEAGPFGARVAGIDTLIGGGPVLSIGPVPESRLLALLRKAGLRVVELPAVFPAGGAVSALRLAEAVAGAVA